MTHGEKMIWASVFGHEYAARMADFRINVHDGTFAEQQAEHRKYSAGLACEAASHAIAAVRWTLQDDPENAPLATMLDR